MLTSIDAMLGNSGELTDGYVSTHFVICYSVLSLRTVYRTESRHGSIEANDQPDEGEFVLIQRALCRQCETPIADDASSPIRLVTDCTCQQPPPFCSRECVAAFVENAITRVGADDEIVCPGCNTESQPADIERYRTPHNDDELFASARTEVNGAMDTNDRTPQGRLRSRFGQLVTFFTPFTRRQQA